MRFAQRLSGQPKHLKTKSSDSDIYRSLIPSVVGMVLCAACLCSTSWAWFTSTASLNMGEIEAATYGADVSVSQMGVRAVSACEKNADGTTTYTFSDAGAYTVKLGYTGTSKTGYCTLEFNGVTYYTPQLTSGSITISVYSTGDQVLVVTPQWGTHPGDATIADGGTIGDATIAS